MPKQHYPNLVPVLFFGFDISLHTLSFLKCFLLFLFRFIFKWVGIIIWLIKYVMTILFHLQHWYFLQEWCPEGAVLTIYCNIILQVYQLKIHQVKWNILWKFNFEEGDNSCWKPVLTNVTAIFLWNETNNLLDKIMYSVYGYKTI